VTTTTGATEYVARYGPWALVVGGSAGVGAAAAREAAARGLNVVSVARRTGLLEEQRADLESRYRVRVRPVTLDLAEPAAAEALLRAVDGLEIGLLIYNAAAEPRGYFLDLPLAEHLTNLHVNGALPTVLVHHLGARMAGRGHGGIVLVSSLGALQGGKVFTSYFASKAYLWILAEGLWAELREAGVDVAAYIVGATKTSNYKGQVADPTVGSLAGDPAAARLKDPADASDVGRRILDIVSEGPTAFVDEVDEHTARSVLGLSRRAAVERMSLITGNIRR
jgi:short-subunit dehydrogenase